MMLGKLTVTKTLRLQCPTWQFYYSYNSKKLINHADPDDFSPVLTYENARIWFRTRNRILT
jgi:hypothetical protein